MTTARDLITEAAREAGILGVGQTLLAEDENAAFTRLNMMIAQWQQLRYYIWHLVDKFVTSTGAQFYTVGPGGDFNIAYRPTKIESAFLRIPGTTIPGQAVDFPLAILESMEDYSRIALKGLTSFTQYVFLDTAYPLAKVYPWPIPQDSLYELHLQLRDVLAQFATINSTYDFPPEYQAAIHYNLAKRLRVAYRLPADSELNALAQDATQVVKQANTQIPRLTMPDNLVRPGVYNIYSDQVR